jgi:RNA polymerase sigma factor FliA
MAARFVKRCSKASDEDARTTLSLRAGTTQPIKVEIVDRGMNERAHMNQSEQKTMQDTVGLDDAQREQLLLAHLPQVQYIARRIHSRLPRQVLFEDLVHAGIIGLIDAVRKYDPGKNVQLRHYAEFRIRGAILDSLRQVDWSPRALRRQGRRLEQAISHCKALLGRDPTEPEIANELNMTLHGLQRLLGDLRGLDIGSLYADANEPGSEEILQSCAVAEEDNPYYQTLRAEMTHLLEMAIEELPDREREVVALYRFEELTMKEVGVVLGIGESRVSQVHTAALVRLRARLGELLDRPPCSADPSNVESMERTRLKSAGTKCAPNPSEGASRNLSSMPIASN